MAQSTLPRGGRYHGWNIVAVCALSQTVANGLPVNAFTLFVQDWFADLHAPISSLQLGLAALGVFSSLFAPFVGTLVDKYPARVLMGGGLDSLGRPESSPASNVAPTCDRLKIETNTPAVCRVSLALSHEPSSSLAVSGEGA